MPRQHLNLLLCASLLITCGSARAQVDDRYHLQLTTAIGPTGSERTVEVLLDSVDGALGMPEPISGWSFGVCHDDTLLGIADVLQGSTVLTINNGDEPDFYTVNTTPLNGSGWNVGALIDFVGIVFLDAGMGYQMNTARYELLGMDETAVLDFCDTLGAPPVATIIVVDSVNSRIPVQTSGAIDIAGFDFVRGDCDLSGSVNLADVILIFNFLFPQGGSPPMFQCMGACDTNDDDTYNLSDPVFLLNATFGQPPIPLVAPYPDCGPDPTPGPFGCDNPTSCP